MSRKSRKTCTRRCRTQWSHSPCSSYPLQHVRGMHGTDRWIPLPRPAGFGHVTYLVTLEERGTGRK